jgi:hypothetical protein
MEAYAQSFFPKDEIEKIPFYNLNPQYFDHIEDKFYNKLFKAWEIMHYHSPETSDEVCKEMIWRNSHLKIDNNTMLYQNCKVKKKTLYMTF